MNPDRRYPDRTSRRRYSARQPLQSTKALTAKLATLAVVAALAIGGLIAAQMAVGKDPSLGPKAVPPSHRWLTTKNGTRGTRRSSPRLRRSPAVPRSHPATVKTAKASTDAAIRARATPVTIRPFVPSA